MQKVGVFLGVLAGARSTSQVVEQLGPFMMGTV